MTTDSKIETPKLVATGDLLGSLRELREKVASSGKPGDTDPTPEQWRDFVATWDDAFLLKWVEFTENPPDAWKQLAALCAG